MFLAWQVGFEPTRKLSRPRGYSPVPSRMGVCHIRIIGVSHCFVSHAHGVLDNNCTKKVP